LNHEHRGSDRDRFARRDGDPRTGRKDDVPDPRAVDAAEILDLDRPWLAEVQTGVQSGRQRVSEAHVGVLAAANGHDARRGQGMGDQQIGLHHEQ
jgi:hypothetical protein